MTTQIRVPLWIGKELEDRIYEWKCEKNAESGKGSAIWNGANSLILEIKHEADAIEFMLKFDISGK